MRNLKRTGAILMALALVLSLNLTAFAAVEDTGFSDVAPTPGMPMRWSMSGTMA